MKIINYIIIGFFITISQFSFGQLKVTNQGFVGVGTNVPWQRLHVKGGNLTVENNNSLIRIFPRNPLKGNVPTIGCNILPIVFWDHTVGQNAGYNLMIGDFIDVSDEKFKDEIKSIDSPIEMLTKLEGRFYRMKNNENVPSDNLDPIYRYGFIAQEVEKIIPEIVTTVGEGKSSFKALKYSSVIPILVEGFKLQQETIEQQAEQLILLKEQVNNCCASGSSNRVFPNSDDFNINNGEGKLYQNQPNPFKESTIIKYEIYQKNADGSILIFDMQGTLLKSIRLANDNNGSVSIKGNDLKPGMYLYSLILNNQEVDTKKMIITQ